MRRRRMFPSDDEPLLLSTSPLRMVMDRDAFLTFTGIPPESVMVDPILATPLPLYPDEQTWASAGLKRWPGTRAAAMWHPLMWLPQRVHARFEVVDDDGRRALEDSTT